MQQEAFEEERGNEISGEVSSLLWVAGSRISSVGYQYIWNTWFQYQQAGVSVRICVVLVVDLVVLLALSISHCSSSLR